MIEDKCGRMDVLYHDVSNNLISGDFDFIPENAVTATIKYEYFEIDKVNKCSGCYKIILGNPIYETYKFITANDEMNQINDNEKIMLVVGNMQGLDYYIIPSEQDIVTRTRDEFVSAVQQECLKFLEVLDFVDVNSLVLKNKSKLKLTQ